MFKSVIFVTFTVLFLVKLCTSFAYPGAQRAICMLRQDEGPCLLGSYTDICGKQTCYRLPGQKCDMLTEGLYYGKCHRELTCTCGKCFGCMQINGVRKCGDVDICSRNKMNSYAKKHSNLFNSEYYY